VDVRVRPGHTASANTSLNSIESRETVNYLVRVIYVTQNG
jgi:hypothetical protein